MFSLLAANDKSFLLLLFGLVVSFGLTPTKRRTQFSGNILTCPDSGLSILLGLRIHLGRETSVLGVGRQQSSQEPRLQVALGSAKGISPALVTPGLSGEKCAVIFTWPLHRAPWLGAS